MKKIILSLSLLAGFITATAQVPMKFNYQGVARNSTGQPIAAQSLGLRLSIIDLTPDGAVVYQETQAVTTNAYGLYNLAIGNGTIVTGDMNSVNWATGDKYIKVEMDPDGGTAYTDLGTTQLLSVPYAMYAASGTPGPAGPAGADGATGPAGPAGSANITGNENYLVKFNGTSSGNNSVLYQSTTGAIGIGTTAPNNGYLHINGDGIAYHGMHFTSTTTGSTLSDGLLYGPANSNSLEGVVWNFENAKLRFGTSNTERLTINGTGEVGINNTTPNARLHIKGYTTNPVVISGTTYPATTLVVESNNAPTTTSIVRNVVSAANGSTSENQAFFARPSGTGGSTNIGYFVTANSSTTGTNYGVYSYATSGSNNYAGYFLGTLYATTGTFGTKPFMIDHPLDPENKYLRHSSIESPDMMNIYNGNITTDANGYATVTMPNYFEALNEDFKYQLTVIGTFAQAIIKEELQQNKFVIQTNQPHVKVSWQVSGIRHDAVAKKFPIIVEEEKLAKDKGKYMEPAAFNQPEEKGIHFLQSMKEMKETSKTEAPKTSKEQSKVGE